MIGNIVWSRLSVLTDRKMTDGQTERQAGMC